MRETKTDILNLEAAEATLSSTFYEERGTVEDLVAALESQAQAFVDAQREKYANEVKEWLYERRCVSCKYARVTPAHPDDHPLAARTYCGNDDSPAFDRNVSFAGDDTCGHWAKGRPEHDDFDMPKQVTPVSPSGATHE